MSNSQLRQDIVDELEFDPSFNGEHIGVVVDSNVVTLTGHVNSYAEKLAAIAAVGQSKACTQSPKASRSAIPISIKLRMIRSLSGRQTL